MEQPKTDLNTEAWENANAEGEGPEAESGGETMESLLAQQAVTTEKLADRKVADPRAGPALRAFEAQSGSGRARG